MYRSLGLSRDAFAPVCDGALFWENAQRARARKTAMSALRSGRGVWLRGGEGSGRGVFLARVAGDLALEGRPVLFCEDPAPTTPEDLLSGLLDACGAMDPRRGDLLAQTEAVYSRLLETFCQAGTTVVIPAPGPIPPNLVEEMEILAGLRVLGRPLAVVALAGEGAPNCEGLEEVRLPVPGPDDLRACLAHRAAACGRPDLFDSDRLLDIVSRAGGFGNAVQRARHEVARLAFQGAGSASSRSDVSDEPDGGPQFLDAHELGEVDRLFESLEPGSRPLDTF